MTVEERRFAYTAVKPSGEPVSALVAAADARDALRRLSNDKLVVTRLEEAGATGRRTSGRRTISTTERILVLKQLAVMARAGVDLLEALHTIASALAPSAMSQALRDAAAGLRRGDPVAKAFRTGVPGYPAHVYAMIQVGEATGRLDHVLNDAARQLGFDHRIRREVRNALVYPAFLLGAGALAVLFLFLIVVPRFAAMIGDARADLTGLPAFVLGLGTALREHFILIAAGVIVAGFGIAAALSKPANRAAMAAALSALPVIGGLIAARQRATWARIMGLATSSGIGLLPAAELALAAIPECRFRRELASAFRALRAGKPVAEAFGATGALAPVDLSLLRAGQRSGALPEMFDAIASTYEDELADRLKRMTVVTEQAAIALVALAIGAVVLGLVGALTGIYDTIG